MGTDARRGQALVETALGMFAFALVMAALCGYAHYIVASLDMRRTMRARAGTAAMASSLAQGTYSTASGSAVLRADPLAAEYVFGSEDVVVREKVSLPSMNVW